MQIKNSLISIKSVIDRAKQRGFFHIIISSSLVKIVSFISAIFLPRFLSKPDYGLLTYVDNIRNYILMINGIGIANATLRYCAKDDTDNNKKGILIASLAVGIIFDFLMIIVTIICYIYIPFPFSGASNLLMLMSLLPIFVFLFEDIQLFLRACFENKKYSVMSFVYSALMVVLQVAFAIFWSLNGVVIARYISVILCIIMGFIFINQTSIIKSKIVFPNLKQLIGMIRFGIVMLAANATSLIMLLNETFIIGIILKNESALAEYKVAEFVLTISLFLLQSVIVFIFPYFVKHSDDKVWIWSKFKKIFQINTIIMIPLHILMIAFSGIFIHIVFGANYLDAVPIMRTLLIASLGQSIFRGLTGNILAAIGEERYNLRINIIFTILHVIIDIWAVKTFGLNGAAIALTVVYFTSGILMTLHLRKVCKKAQKVIE